ncbi:ankyrin repeat-containing protein At5g02620-like [Syzygium oleosum]|uniref:ankyrin repeat-containing protein At5g02620-like n=1 Tax=Syzygium oleosum TaxID=219896 RepID=UPI0024BB7ECA|nr:ankyrin repeat-containing protein At5g02620-like [Syzygium oleosum]
MSQEHEPRSTLAQTSEDIIRGDISPRPSMSSLSFEACFPAPEASIESFFSALQVSVGQPFPRGYIPLLDAALRGDWKEGIEFISHNPSAEIARITRKMETALHIAAGAGHREFIEELVTMMTPDDLAMQNKDGNTALCFAAASGVREIAKAMVDKNPQLPLIKGSNEATPLYIAALLGKQDMVRYLLSVTDDTCLTESDLMDILVATISSNLFDVALQLIGRHPKLALARMGNGETALHVLARMPSAFSCRSQLAIQLRCFFSFAGTQEMLDPKRALMPAVKLLELIWREVSLLDDGGIGKLLREPSRLLFTAAELGNYGFLTVLIRLHPELLWKVDDQKRSIFHVAVAHRHEKIFRLIYDIGAHKDMIAAYKDENDNNMLHLAGNLAPSSRLKIDSGAALQMRRELLWFKEVEKIVQPSYREMKNSEGKTPFLLFTEKHKELRQEAEKWMRDTASSCMVVATLIATVMFAATFTVPGGNNNDTGKPIFLHHRSFIIFALATALAIFSSATSILMFLSILTSRYLEEDFLHSLPNRLVLGLGSLFVSIATMMVAFGATLIILLGHSYALITVPIAAFVSGTVTLFALLQFPLLSDMIRHMCSKGLLSHPEDRPLF